MRLKLSFQREKASGGDYTIMEISQEMATNLYKILYMAVIDEDTYHRLKPFEGKLYTEDSPGLLKNWINNNVRKNDNKTFAIDT